MVLHFGQLYRVFQTSVVDDNNNKTNLINIIQKKFLINIRNTIKGN